LVQKSPHFQLRAVVKTMKRPSMTIWLAETMIVACLALADRAFAGDDVPGPMPHVTGGPMQLEGSRPATPPGRDPPVPAVAVRVRVPSTGKAGEELEYHLCVENASTAPAHHIVLHNTLPANARYVRADPEPSVRSPDLVWKLGTLPAMTYRDVKLVLSPTGPGELRTCARVQFEHGQCVCTEIKGPALRLQAKLPAEAAIRESFTVQLTVENTGNAEATNVMLTETPATGLDLKNGKSPLSWDLDTLAPGQSRTVEYQATPTILGKLCSQARVTAAGGLKQEDEHCVTIGEPKLTLALTGPSHRYLNLSATYRLTVANPGNMALKDVVLTNPLPPRTIFLSAGEGAELTANSVRWSLDTLEPGGSRTLELVFRSEEAQRICDRATVRGDHGLTAEAEACTEFLGVSALLLEMIDTEDPIEVGTETTYTVLVRNQGTVPVTNIQLAAIAPAQLEVTRVTGPSDSHRDGQRLLIDPFIIKPEAELQFIIHVRALSAGDARFKLQMTADQLTAGPVREEESTQVYVQLP
jgi:uncharacterized repeat protein (TIGR01451 family)